MAGDIDVDKYSSFVDTCIRYNEYDKLKIFLSGYAFKELPKYVRVKRLDCYDCNIYLDYLLEELVLEDINFNECEIVREKIQFLKYLYDKRRKEEFI